jgi:hypothetical protein
MKSIEELLIELFDENPRYRDIAANESMVLNACERPVNAANLRAAFMRVKHQLAAHQDYLDAYRAFYQNHPELKMDATNAILDNEHHGDPISAESLEELLTHPRIAAQLTFNGAYQAQQVLAAKRASLIKELNRPDLEDLPLEDLRRMAEQHRMQSLSAAELRKEMKDQRVANLRVANEKPPVPSTYEVTVANDYFRFNETISMTRVNFFRLDKADIRKILSRCGNEQVDAFLGVKPHVVERRWSN